jgi:molybdate transport system regulatory protein
MIELDGRFWLTKDGKPFLGEGRVELLRKIDEIGSIHSASKAMKMSYKAAWDMLKQMNELADKPLLEKQIGGKGGGGTKLTPYAYELIGTFEKFSKLHRSFMDRFKKAGDSPEKLQSILNRTFLTTSARNQFLCKVVNIDKNDIASTITMSLNKKILFRSVITTKSLLNMGLDPGKDIYAIIKSNDIQIVLSEEQSEDNYIDGEITYIDESEKNAEVHLKTDEGVLFVALVKKGEIAELKIGTKAFAMIKKENILIGI